MMRYLGPKSELNVADEEIFATSSIRPHEAKSINFLSRFICKIATFVKESYLATKSFTNYRISQLNIGPNPFYILLFPPISCDSCPYSINFLNHNA
jgi:hypothetical protein